MWLTLFMGFPTDPQREEINDTDFFTFAVRDLVLKLRSSKLYSGGAEFKKMSSSSYFQPLTFIAVYSCGISIAGQFHPHLELHLLRHAEGGGHEHQIKVPRIMTSTAGDVCLLNKPPQWGEIIPRRVWLKPSGALSFWHPMKQKNETSLSDTTSYYYALHCTPKLIWYMVCWQGAAVVLHILQPLRRLRLLCTHILSLRVLKAWLFGDSDAVEVNLFIYFQNQGTNNKWLAYRKWLMIRLLYEKWLKHIKTCMCDESGW